MNQQREPRPVLTAVCVLALTAFGSPAARATIVLGAAGSYTVISETGVPQINLSSSTIIGNVGIASTSGQLANSSPSIVKGNVDFAGPVNATAPGNVSGSLTGGVNLAPAVSAFENLATTSSSNASGAPTTSLTPGGTINITAGKLVGSTYYFNVGSVGLSGGGPLTISGTGAAGGSNVVFNFTGPVNLNFGVNLTGGLTMNSVLFNVTGSSTFSAATNGAAISGIILDPGGGITLSNTPLNGHIYGGGTSAIQISGGSNVNGVPEPSTFAIAATLSVASFGYWVRRRKTKPTG